MAKDVSWRYVATDQILANKPCELIGAYLAPSAANADATLYDGSNATGDPIIKITSAVVTLRQFNPKEPIPCSKGLFIDIGSNVTGVLVLWRNL